jgi:hypothetical protein
MRRTDRLNTAKANGHAPPPRPDPLAGVLRQLADSGDDLWAPWAEQLLADGEGGAPGASRDGRKGGDRGGGESRQREPAGG